MLDEKYLLIFRCRIERIITERKAMKAANERCKVLGDEPVYGVVNFGNLMDAFIEIEQEIRNF